MSYMYKYFYFKMENKWLWKVTKKPTSNLMVRVLYRWKMIGKDNHSIDHTPKHKRRITNKKIIKNREFQGPLEKIIFKSNSTWYFSVMHVALHKETTSMLACDCCSNRYDFYCSIHSVVTVAPPFTTQADAVMGRPICTKHPHQPRDFSS
jgi:hypothetical protein